MKNISIDISGKIDNTYINPLIEIKNIADALNIPFFIIGAFARDIIMEHFHKIKAPRMTMDIDLGIRVSNWNQFDKLINNLELSGKFKKTKEKQTITYKDISIDIVPFGSISNKNEKISWPPEDRVIMSVMGFDEVYINSTLVKLQNNPLLEVKIPTLPGLSILKLLAWNDNFPDRSRDAEDLVFIMMKYEYTEIDDKLYGSELQLLKNENFDNQIAAIVLLGKEMRMICAKRTIEYIRKILNHETSEDSNYNLAKDMSITSKINFERILFFLKKLKKGFTAEK